MPIVLQGGLDHLRGDQPHVSVESAEARVRQWHLVLLLTNLSLPAIIYNLGLRRSKLCGEVTCFVRPYSSLMRRPLEIFSLGPLLKRAWSWGDRRRTGLKVVAALHIKWGGRLHDWILLWAGLSFISIFLIYLSSSTNLLKRWCYFWVVFIS